MEIGSSSKKRRAGGRNKTQLRLVEREEDRLITFSKRKAGINKKAAELSIMCDAQVAFILFSPKGNAFAFGHPDLKSVVNKFLGREEYPINSDPRFTELIDLHRREKNEGLVEYHNMLQTQVSRLIKHKEFMKKMAAIRGDGKGWWDVNKVEDMKNLKQVEELHRNIVVFQEALCNHMEMLQMIRQAIPPSSGPSCEPSFSSHVSTMNLDGAPVTGLGGGGYTSSKMANGGSSDGHFF